MDEIDRFLEEDIGSGDVTTLMFVPDVDSTASIVCEDDAVVAGLEEAEITFSKLGATARRLVGDGTFVERGTKVMEISGPARGITTAERTALNIMMRMSGIATMTNKYVKKLEGTKTRVLDTRKTTPGMRILEKMAVKIGGGCNHRIGLFDMILLKDNHVDFSGGIHNAVTRAKEYCKAKGKNLKIELEVRNFDELQQALDEGVDRIMFDNFTPEDTKKAVEIVAGRCETESSGGITYETMLPYAQAGVDFISFGALTHSVKGMDMSFKAC